MDNIFSNAVIYMFHVSIILLNVVVISSKAIQTAYFTDIHYTWKEAKERCKMIGLFDKMQFPDTNGTLGWVDAPVEYSQWVEYKSCVYVKPQFIDKHKSVTYGDQLQQCLHFCEDYDYIGLQQTNCSCLSLLEISINTIKSGCSRKEICRGDKYAYCANGTSNLNCFIIYKKVNINEQLRIGNCLSVSVYDQRSSFTANPCGEIFKPLCKGVDVRSQDWISSFSQCKLGLFVSYDIYKESQGWNKGHFWLANLRRPIINHSPEFEPKYCIAVSTQKGDPQVSRHVRQCNKELPVLCAVTNMTSSDNKPSTMSVEVPGLESDANTTNNILLVALVITAVLAVVVIIAVIVLCIRRRTSSRSGHQPIIVPTNEVTYAMVNKPTKEKTPDHSTRNNPADDTYDHMEHHRLSQNQNPSESNYDTIQSVGLEEIENDYDVTSETDRPKQIVLDDTAEYSHVKVEHLEIKDSPT